MPDPAMVSPLPIPPTLTIDDSPNDRALATARQNNPNAEEHGSTDSAVNNLQANAAGPGSIIGHGAPGVFQTHAATRERIRYANRDVWVPELARLHGHTTALVIYGCRVGFGADGDLFLATIANTIGAPVTAPTGILYCNQAGVFRLEANTVWKTVQPNAQPAAAAAAPAQPPPPPPMALPSSVLDAVFFTEDGDAQDSKTSKAITAEVIWDKPITLADGEEPLAIPTGKLQVTRKLPGQTGLQSKTYLVLAGVLLQEEVKPGVFVYYQTTVNFELLTSKLDSSR